MASRSRSSTPGFDLGDEAAALELLPRLYGDRGRAFLSAPHPTSVTVNLGLYHLART